MTRTPSLHQSRRLVIKIGSALLVDAETGRLRSEWLQALAEDVATLKASGQDVILVSSGAVAVGRTHLGLTHGSLKLEEKQACAAVGQILLAQAYQQIFSPFDLTCGQVLLSLQDTEERRRHLNARATLSNLLKMGVIPIANENDTVATSEIRYGDNDRLAARVAQMTSADTLILLSDIDGLFTADPRENPKAELIPVIPHLSTEIEAMAGTAPRGYSSGGMITKLQAARIAVSAGCHMVIAKGIPLHPIKRLSENAPCSWFLAQATPLTARKQWIGGAIAPLGKIVIDPGAEQALLLGKSLLPAGVTKIDGAFHRGDALSIYNQQGQEIAKGLSAYHADDARLIMGRKSEDIEVILGFQGRQSLVHRDDLVLLSHKRAAT